MITSSEEGLADVLPAPLPAALRRQLGEDES
jgi:hypothetical protein